MSIYAVFDVEVLDPEAYKPYTQNVPAMIAKAGGRYLARGGELTILEGDPGVKRVVILEFPTEAAFRSWYDSEEYKPYAALRRRATRSKAHLVAGV
jgi:uncharacterized protein (DUF1330 family)